MQNIFIKPRFPLSVINVYLINVASEQSIIEHKMNWLDKENNVEFFMMFFWNFDVSNLYVQSSISKQNKQLTFEQKQCSYCSGWNLSVFFFFTRSTKMEKEYKKIVM